MDFSSKTDENFVNWIGTRERENCKSLYFTEIQRRVKYVVLGFDTQSGAADEKTSGSMRFHSLLWYEMWLIETLKSLEEISGVKLKV